MHSTLNDLRFALRQLRRSPGFALTAILTLALGIGAVTAVFSLIDDILLHPLPYRNPDRLLTVSETLPQQSDDEVGVSAGEYLDYESQNRSFSQVAAYESDGFNLTGTAHPLRVNAAAVSASTFPLLGASPELGRTFTRAEDRYGAERVVILSHALWKDQFGGDPRIIGRTVRLDDQSYTVIGVMPAAFQFPFDGAPLSERASLWIPMTFAPDLLAPDNRTMQFGVGLIGRLKHGVTPEQAQEDVQRIANDFMRQYAYTGSIRVAPHVHRFAADAVQKAKPLLMLLAVAALCVLLIACSNVANLLLARASRRTQEMALRTAIGASRSRLIRQCMVESVLLALGGAAAGIVLALTIIAGLKRFGPVDIPSLQNTGIHPLALLFAFGLSLLTSVLFGLVPAWRLSHLSPQMALKTSAQVGTDRGSQRLQNSAASIEIALALVLLITGGLLLRSFVHLVSSPFGFDPDNTFIVRTILNHNRYPDLPKRSVVQEQMLQKLSQLPGVTAVAEASHLPLSDVRQIGFRLESAGPDDFHLAENSLISPGYFRAMGIPLLRGRDFTSQDRENSLPVAIINNTLARKYFPGKNPIGLRFQWGDRMLFTIIGVAADVHIDGLNVDTPPTIYNDMFQVQSGASSRTAFVIRSHQTNEALFNEVQQQLRSLDKDLPLYDMTTLKTLVSESLARRRFTILLFGSFAIVALILSLIGIFGVMSYLVAQRSREFGVRMALGAGRTRITYLVLKRGSAIALTGCSSGLLLSIVASRLLVSNLYQVSRYDPLTLTALPIFLFAVVLAAVYIPARRAASIDPMQALRTE